MPPAKRCGASDCRKTVKPGAKWCSTACGERTRSTHRRRSAKLCERPKCSNPIGPRGVKYCSERCRELVRLDKLVSNRCVDCDFPVYHHAQRCRDCANQLKAGLNQAPEVRKKMSEAAKARYGHQGKEEQVLALAAEGLKQAEIGRRLGMCQGTVWAIVRFGSWAGYRDYKRRQG